MTSSSRKSLVTIHSKAGDQKRVMELYESIAQDLVEQKDPIGAVRYLQKILMLDRTRKDISDRVKQLYVMDERHRSRRRSVALTFAGIFCFGAIGVLYYLYEQHVQSRLPDPRPGHLHRREQLRRSDQALSRLPERVSSQHGLGRCRCGDRRDRGEEAGAPRGQEGRGQPEAQGSRREPRGLPDQVRAVRGDVRQREPRQEHRPGEGDRPARGSRPVHREGGQGRGLPLPRGEADPGGAARSTRLPGTGEGTREEARGGALGGRLRQCPCDRSADARGVSTREHDA